MARKKTSPKAQSTSTAQDRMRSSAKTRTARQDLKVNEPKEKLIARSEAASVTKRSLQSDLKHHASRTEIQLIVIGDGRFEINLVIDPRPKQKKRREIDDEPVRDPYNQPIKLGRWARLGQWFKKVGSGLWSHVFKQLPAVLGWLIVGLFRK